MPPRPGARARTRTITGVSREARAALKAAGFADRSSLATFNVTTLGGAANKLGLRELDRIHAQQIEALYPEELTPKLKKWLGEQRLPPWEVVGFFEICGTTLEPFPWQPATIDFDSIRTERVYRRFLPKRWEDLFEIPKKFPDPRPPGGGWTTGIDGTVVAPATFADRVDLLSGGELAVLSVDRNHAEQLLQTRPAAGTIGEALALAQGLLARGEPDLALRLAAHVGSARARGLSAVERYQVNAVAPAVAAVAAGSARPDLVVRTTAAALRIAEPGSEAATTALRFAVADSRSRADGAMAAASFAAGPAASVTRELARRQYLEVLTGGQLGRGARNTPLAVSSATALLDLYRAVAVAGTTGTQAVKWTNPADPTFDGRTLPRNGPIWLLGNGGLSSTIDPFVKGHALHAWRRLHQLHSIEPLSGSLLPQSDLFRFDWLLGEVRRLAEDAARIEQLLASFRQMLLDLATAKIGSITGITAELARLVDQLVKKVQQLTADIPALITRLITTVRDAAILTAIVAFLRRMPTSNWVAIATAALAAIPGGPAAVSAAVVATINGFLTPTIAAELATVAATLTATLTALQPTIDNAALPQTLLDAFSRAAAAAGVPNVDTQIIQPLRDALAFNLNTIAAPAIAALTSATTVPPFVTALIAAYIVAPFVALIFSGLGLFTLVLGIEFLISLALRALADPLGSAADLRAQAAAAAGQITALVNGLTSALADVGALQGMVTGVLAQLDALTDLIPANVAKALQDALTTARDVVLDNTRDLAGALQRSFFRETLEFLDVVPLTFSTQLPNEGTMLGYDDPRFGSSAKVAAVLSAFEAERVARATGPQELLTQVLSLRQIVPGGVGALQPLLQGVPLNFAVSQAMLDQVAPGLHRMLIKDIQVQFDFDIPQSQLLTLASILSNAAQVAGGATDPALDGRVPGGGFPRLPVAAGRIPTGIPALLTHRGVSRVRLKPSVVLAGEYFDGCGDPVDPEWLPSAIRGTRLLPDPDPEANAAGWRVLELLDPAESLLFSHLDVLEDGIRFVYPHKGLKPFEHRGLVASWTLEVPALVLRSVVAQLPAIRDVRLVVSTVAQYDRALADLLPLPPVTVTEPTPTSLPSTVEDLLRQLNDSVDDVVAALDDIVDNLGADLGSLVDVVQALGTQSLLVLGSGLQLASGNRLGAVLLTSNAAGLLSGTTTQTWAVNAQTLTAAGIDPTKVVRVVQAIITPILNTPLLGGPPVVWPTTSGQFGFDPAGTAPLVTRNITFSGGSVTVPAGNLTSPQGGTLPSPVGDWTLKLPAGMPALDQMIVGLILEVAP